MAGNELEDCLLHLEHHAMGPDCWAYVSTFYANLRSSFEALEAYRQSYEWGCMLALGYDPR